MTRTSPRRTSLALAAAAAAGAVLVSLAPVSSDAASRTELLLTGTVERFAVDDFATGAEADAEITYVNSAAGAVQVPTSDLADVADGATVRVGLADSATAEVAGGSVQNPATGDVPQPEAGADVTSLAVLAEPSASLTDTGSGTAVEPAAVTSTHSVLVVVAKPAGGTAPSISASALASTINGGVANYWSRMTRGAVTFTATAYGSTVTSSFNPCTNSMQDTFSFWDDVKAKVGFTEGAGKHLVVYFDKLTACGGTAGLGTIGSGITSGGLVWTNGYNTVGVLGHELGHNLGLGHSQTLACTVGGVRVTDATPSQCQQKSYQDTNDIMGVSWQNQGYLNASHLRFLGVLPAGAEVAPTESGSTTIVPLASGTGTRVITLPDGATRYVLELRSAVGQDAWMSSLPGWGSLGVTVRREFDPATTAAFPLRASYLLDGDTATSDLSFGALKVALRPGTWYQLDGGAVAVRVASVSASSATVEYRLGSSDQRVAPAMPVVGTPTVALRTGTVTSAGAGVRALMSWRWKVSVGSDYAWSTAGTAATATATPSTVAWTARAGAPDGSVVSATGTGSLRYRPENATGWTWSKGWTTTSSSAALGRRVKSSLTKGASVSTVVTGRSVAVLLQRSASSGSAAVYVDGHRVATVRLTASRTSTVAAYAVRFASVGRHTVKVVNLTGGSRGRVGVEGVITTA